VLVRLAIDEGVELQSLSLEQLRSVVPTIDNGVYESLTADAALARRDVVGGASPRRVREAIENAKARLSTHERRS
jgi:argininosuccinate lyase